MWQQAVRRWHASCARAGRFGSHTFWESQYERGKAPNEWFLAAEQAATSTAEAFAAHEKVHGLGGPFAKVLHIGCGTSRLGNCLISALASHSQVSGRVMSVDYSAVAVAAAQAAVAMEAGEQQQQLFRVWDAASGTPPPALPNTMYSCGMSSRYDLLVDKGTLDALCFATDDALVAYLAAMRTCLLAPSLDSTMPPLLVHFTEDPPEVRGELFASAFPTTNGERWRCSCVELDLEGPGSLGDGTTSAYYRYTVHRDMV
jgi:hypothetical protein